MKTIEKNGSTILGPNGLPFATAKRPNPDLQSRGFTGITRYRGLISEEYAPALSGTRIVDVYTSMRSDGLVEAILAAFRQPVVAAAWQVEPADVSGGEEHAEFVQINLFEHLGSCWEDVLRQVLTYLQFGFACFAKNWEVREGQVFLSELRPLHPRTILQGGKNWEFDEAGHVVGVWQYGTDGVNFREEFIPGPSLLLFSHDADFGNPQGRSLLRSIYKHWYIKDQLYRAQAVGLERAAVGTPIGYYEAGTTQDDQDALYAFCTNVATHEHAGAIFPAGTTLENFSVQVQTEHLKTAIQHHDSTATKAALCQFLNLGQEGVGGAYALSTDQTDMFLRALEGIGDYIAARFNRGVIQELVQYNFGPQEKYPKLAATIARQTAANLANVMSSLAASGVLTIDEPLEDWTREQMQMPERTVPRPKPEEMQPVSGGGKTVKDPTGGRQRATGERDETLRRSAADDRLHQLNRWLEEQIQVREERMGYFGRIAAKWRERAKQHG